MGEKKDPPLPSSSAQSQAEPGKEGRAPSPDSATNKQESGRAELCRGGQILLTRLQVPAQSMRTPLLLLRMGRAYTPSNGGDSC